MSYDEYMNSIKVNKARFEEYYANVKLESEQADALRELAGSEGGPARMMVIGEDWCGDVVRELPVLARVAEAAGLELRIFPPGRKPRHYERVPQRGAVYVHPGGGVLRPGARIHLPLD